MQKKYTEIITDFLKSHPAISINAIEKDLSLPQSTIGQAINGNRLLPVNRIFPLLCLLSEYGLQIDGYTLTFDPIDGTLSGRKWIENIETIEDGAGFAYIVKEYRMLATDYHDLL